jgi:Short C-terminal domain
MNLREKWTEARERDRQEREAGQARMRRFSKIEQLKAMGAPVPASETELLSLAEETLDAMLAAEKSRQAELYETFVRCGTVTIYRAFGVQILKGDDKVYSIGSQNAWEKTNSSRLLGPLARAEAKVTDGTSAFSPGKAMFMPLATAALARKETADAMIVFAEGTVHSVALDGSTAVRQARKECVQFNAQAGSATSAVPASNGDPAVKLQKLQELRDSGLLSQQEYDAKRTEVIDSI